MENLIKIFLNILLLSQLLLFEVYCERTKDKMYDKITGSNGCYRRLNSTHQIGCSSKRGGSTGVIQYCVTLGDLDFILHNGTAPPYIPVLPTRFFTLETVEKLIDSKKVSGLVLHRNGEQLSHFTHENQCPNPLSSLNGTCKQDSIWNPHGTGLLYADIPFPIFYVESEEEIVKMKDCFGKFNNYSYDSHVDRSLCSLELKSFMYATTNTQICRRRSNLVTNLNPAKFCDPLGDNNIWAALHPLVNGTNRNETKPIRDYKYIVIAARMDTTSMFEKTSGANSPVTGIVTLLYTAKLLKSILKLEDVTKAKKNVLFILFNGETYDYIGSQRLLYDMQKSNFPVPGLTEDNNILPIIKPENISLFIEISQLGNSTDGNIFMHYLKNSTQIASFYQSLVKNEGRLGVKNVSSSLPPASLHTFLKENPDFPGLILSDHESHYTNPFYNSIYDNASNIQFYYNTTDNRLQEFIANFSVAIARSVYEIVTTQSYRGDVSVDLVLVDELFHCYLEDTNCRVHAATQKSKILKVPVSLYVGVDHVINFATSLTALTLGWFTGDVDEENTSCSNKPRNYAYQYHNMSQSIYDLNVTKCYRMTMNTTEAVSPAFIIPDYDWSSGIYSSWTESTWAEMGVTMFLKPSSAHERMTIAIGSMSLIFSFILVYFIKSQSHILFTLPLPTDAPTDC